MSFFVRNASPHGARVSSIGRKSPLLIIEQVPDSLYLV
jgi:hypothetical protein